MGATSAIEITQQLVRLPSVNPGYDPASPGEAAVVAWLLDWAGQNSFAVRCAEVSPGRQNVILRLSNGEGPHLLLNGHTDTVAVDNMSIPPFSGEIRKGRIWGRGTADMKGPLACMLEALLVLRERARQWRGTVTLACVVDEEVTFSGIRHFLAQDSAFDFAVVGEPTRFEVVRGCKGCLRFAIRAHGQPAHSSTPEKGISAISAMASAIAALNTYFAESLSQIRHPALGCSTGSIGLIKGGRGINIVPEFCEIHIDIRLVPGQSWAQTYREIQELVSATDSKVRWELDSSPMADLPFCLEEDEPVVVRSCAAARVPVSRTVNFSCDASKIAAMGIPCIIFGPGDIAQAHTADESISVADLKRGAKAYVRLVENLLPAKRRAVLS